MKLYLSFCHSTGQTPDILWTEPVPRWGQGLCQLINITSYITCVAALPQDGPCLCLVDRACATCTVPKIRFMYSQKLHNRVPNSYIMFLNQTFILDSHRPYICSVGDRFCVSVSLWPVAAMPQNGPRISGGESVYHVGDRVQVNCTSDKSHPAAELRWYINGQQVCQLVINNREQYPKS
jgi:hypothetical protein